MARRASCHREAASADDDPSTPSPTGTPARRMAVTGAMPDDRIMLELGQWATPTPAAPSRTTSSGLGITQWATHDRLVSQPTSANWSTQRRPNIRSENSSSSAFSARWVWSRTSSRSASSAVRTISSGLTVNGEQGARAIRTMAPGAGSWWRATWRSLSARISSSSSTTLSGGRPPSFSDRLIEPWVGWNRMPSSPAAVMVAVSRSPAPRGCR